MGKGIVEIVLVEDNPNDVEMTLHALERHNVTNRIEVLRDGAEALEFVFCTGTHVDRKIEDWPRLILLDLGLPKVDGLEVLRRIKGDERARDIPVVVLSSSREGPDIARAYELGVNSYITKPVDFEQFSESVRQLGLYWLLLNVPPRRRADTGDGPG